MSMSLFLGHSDEVVGWVELWDVSEYVANP